MKKLEKSIYIEFLRILAIILVIFNHTGGITAFSWGADFASVKWFIYLFVSIACKIAVPIFFMISGADLLNRDKDWKWLCQKIVKMGCQLILITLAYILYKYIRYGEIHSLNECLEYLYTGSGLSAHLWYLYAYLAFLISIPLLNAFIKGANGTTIKYLVAIYIGYRIIAIIQFLILKDEWVISYDLTRNWMLEEIFLYPVLGYYLSRMKLDDFSSIKASVITLSSFAMTILLVYIQCFRNGGTFEGIYTQRFHNFLVLIPSMMVFLIVKKYFENREFDKKVTYLISILGSATYGVYIIHIMIKDLKVLQRGFDNIVDNLKINYLLADFLYVFVVWVISTILVLVFYFCQRKIVGVVQGIYENRRSNKI